MSEYFEGTISEFVGWLDGIDSTSGASATGGKQPSGKSIRELLEYRLKNPMYVFEDKENNLYRFFSSTNAYNKWTAAMTAGNTKLAEKCKPFFEITRPAQYYIKIDGGELIKYLVKSDNEYAPLTIKPIIANSAGIEITDSITADWEVLNAGNVVDTFTINIDGAYVNNPRSGLTINLYERLKDGMNQFRVTMRADTIEANPYVFYVTYYLIDFTISSDFAYAPGLPYDADRYTVKVNAKKSTTDSQKIKLYYELDHVPQGTLEQTFSGSTKEFNLSLNLGNLQHKASYVPSEGGTDEELNAAAHISHNLTIYAQLIMSDSEDEQELQNSTFTSNVLYYDFEINSINYGLELMNNFINIRKSTNTYETTTINGETQFVLTGTQYNKISFNYAYYSDREISSNGLLKSYTPTIYWKIVKNYGTEYAEEESLGSTLGNNGIESDEFVFTPTETYTSESDTYLIAYVEDLKQNLIEVRKIPLVVSISPVQIYETDGYSLKLTAFGKTNSSFPSVWEDSKNNIKAGFSNGFPFNNSCGWDNNSLVVKGVNFKCQINYNPFGSNWYISNNSQQIGCTVQVEFMTEDMFSEDDVVMSIGLDNYGILIKPTAAQVVRSTLEGIQVITETNYKTNERLHLTFIFNSSGASASVQNLVYIVNNGILERGADYGGGAAFTVGNGRITIGGSNSGIRIYGIRCYQKDITVRNALDNYIYDKTTNKVALLNRNDLENPISYDKTSKIISTVLISGDLSQILNKEALKDNSESTVDLVFKNPEDKTKNFSITNCRIRKHGQSTLNYPITSMKVWTNKTAQKDEALGLPTILDCEYQTYLDLNKNRYVMRTNNEDGTISVPFNKFVLQANYADSSGVHNGGILRLINDTWYKAKINNEFKLRTNPQLFSTNETITHDNRNINESAGWTTTKAARTAVDKNGNPQIEEYFIKTCTVFRRLNDNSDPIEVDEDIETLNMTNAVEGKNKYGYQWSQYSKVNNESNKFPYALRIAPDSFPCAVFYEDKINAPGAYSFLGTYVFMDDKKSDFTYGERSIYGDRKGLGFIYTDPFCLTNAQKEADTDDNLVWDNDHVLRIECVLVNTTLTSFMDYKISSEVTLDTDEESPTYGEYIETGNPVYCDDIKYEDGVPSKYYWEDYFEMMYPDPEDLVGKEETNAGNNTTKFGSYSKFKRKAQPFVDFLYWIGNLGSKNTETGQRGGKRLLGGQVNQTVLEEFKRTASSHLDLYKMAAYYIFYLRFGLVDSVERNAQLKTYDGIHWHYEPWDMDIALGNKNDGGIAFTPPMTRDTRMPNDNTKYAYSGRSNTTSNFLWDCLEAWDEWANEIVPTVAQALYTAGLDYDSISNMFDKEYAEKWPEHMYNESGTYKYITMRGSENGWLAWLQGARTSHRHWWLSTSMNYYDAKWSCGDFNNHRVYIAADKGLGTPGFVKIKPTSETYFKLTLQDGGHAIPGYNESDPTNIMSTVHTIKGEYAIWDITGESFAVKDPSHIFGATFIEELDLSSLSTGLTSLTLGGAYDKVLGASIKVLNVGVPFYANSNNSGLIDFNENTDLSSITTIYGNVSGAKLNLSGSSSSKSILDNSEEEEDLTANDALKNLISLNLNGQKTVSDTASLLKLNNRRNIENFFAIGTSISTFENAPGGNKFHNLFLPAVMSGYGFSSNISTLILHDCSWDNLLFFNTTVLGESSMITSTDDDGNILSQYQAPNPARFDKVSIPATIKSITYDGSTATYESSVKLFKAWVDSIELAYESSNEITRYNDATNLYNYLKTTYYDTLLDEAYPMDSNGDRYNITGNGVSIDLLNQLSNEVDEETGRINLSYEDVKELGLCLYIKANYRFVARNIKWGSDPNWSEDSKLSFKYIKRLAYFNNGENNGSKRVLTGYIKIYEDENLDTNQLAQLSTWFGDSVFDVTAMNSSLIIDHGKNYLGISIGTGSFLDNGRIYINESDKDSKRVIVKANRFTLRTDISGLNYKWTVFNESGSISSSVFVQTNSSTGVSYIKARESNGNVNDYKVILHVDFYEDPAYIESGNLSLIADSAEIELWIRPVTRPTGWSPVFTNKTNISASIRQLTLDNDMFAQFFGNDNKFNIINGVETPRRNYVYYTKGLEFEIGILPENNDYTATINSYSWTVEPINTINNTWDEFISIRNQISYSTGGTVSDLAQNDNTTYHTLGTENEDDILYYKKNSTPGSRGGIVIGTYNNTNWNFIFKAFKVTCNIGYSTPEKYTINILIIDDNQAILDGVSSTQAPIYAALVNKIISSGGLKTQGQPLYKTDLMTLSGILEIPTDIPEEGLRVNGEDNVSVFKYLTNIEGLRINGCTQLKVPYDSAENYYFKFDEMLALKGLEINNISSVDSGQIDLSSCNNLRYVNTQNTRIGVKLPSTIQEVLLGSPTSFYLANTRDFNIDYIGVQNVQNLESIDILNVNKTVGQPNAYSYKLLYKFATNHTYNLVNTNYFESITSAIKWHIEYKNVEMQTYIGRDNYGVTMYASKQSSIQGKSINVIRFKPYGLSNPNLTTGTLNIFKTTKLRSVSSEDIKSVVSIKVNKSDIDGINPITIKLDTPITLAIGEYLIFGRPADTLLIYYNSTNGAGFFTKCKTVTSGNTSGTWVQNSNCDFNIGLGFES